MNRLLTSLLTVFVGLAAYAQMPTYTLLEAQMYAIENAYSVQTNELEYERAKKVLMENVALGLPQVYASADWTQNISLQSFVVQGADGKLEPLTFGTPYQGNATISGEQLIFDGSYIVAVLASKVVKEDALNGLEKSAIDIKESVANAYHLVLVSEKTVEIIKENLVFITKNFEDSKKMYEVGLMEETDADQLELIKSNLENQLDYAEKQANIARMLLKFNMGMDVNSEIQLSDDIEKLMVFSQDGASLLSTGFDLEDHIDYRKLLTQERGQTLNLKNENMAFVPKLKFNYMYGHNVFSGSTFLFEGTYAQNIQQSIGLNIAVPIISGGSRLARVQQAKIQLKQVEIAKKQVADNLKLQHETARAEYSFALNSYYTQLRNVEIAKKIRDKGSKKFSEGMMSSLEFTQAENQYQDALRDVLNAANNVLDKKVKLEKIIGKYNY